MSTFNGRPIISLPTSPVAPASIEWTATDTVALVISPFTAQQQVQNWQSGWMEGSVSMPPLTLPQARAWTAFLKSLQGQACCFQMGDPLLANPQGSGAGTPVVNGSGQTGYQISTRGWTGSPSLLPGDFIQIGYRLYTVLTPVNAGTQIISIWPQIRESPLDGAAITVFNTVGMFCLKSNARKWSVTKDRVYGMQFEIREAI